MSELDRSLGNEYASTTCRAAHVWITQALCTMSLVEASNAAGSSAATAIGAISSSVCARWSWKARPVSTRGRCFPTTSIISSCAPGDYADLFNARYRRCGHLFQNRFKSTLVEEEAYFIEVVEVLARIERGRERWAFARTIVRGVARKRFMIIPGVRARLLFVVHNLSFGWLTRSVSDLVIRWRRR
jgi:hypothetical protein